MYNIIHTHSFRSSSRCILIARRLASTNLNRPSPPPLPRKEQQEFQELQRAAQTPLAASNQATSEAELTLHPDARKPIQSEFEGDVNPLTGEEGGPKQEPVRKWTADSEGDWSFKGRVTDF